MSRRIITVLIFVAVLPFAFAFKNAPLKKKGVQTIIIDPGHGGKDQGAKGAFTTEAKICLSCIKNLYTWKFFFNGFTKL